MVMEESGINCPKFKEKFTEPYPKDETCGEIKFVKQKSGEECSKCIKETAVAKAKEEKEKTEADAKKKQDRDDAKQRRDDKGKNKA